MIRGAVLACVVAAGCAGCAGSVDRGPGPLRFRVEPPVTLVNDRQPIAAPRKSGEGLVQYYLREDLIEPTRRVLSADAPRRAANINSLGDVPDSAWFTHRALTPEDLRVGPGDGGPDRSRPWRVTGVKVGGAAIGITIKDGRDASYVLKFDERGQPETESSADVVVQRLAWAFGYNVPDNQVVTFARADVVLDADAKIRDMSGAAHKMTDADLEKYLGMGESDHGTFRVLASRLVDGRPVGGIEPEGVRGDDPNDRVPHELRRDLRGQRVLWAWVNHIDLKAQNALVAYTETGAMKWYVLDFGESLGVAARTDAIPRLGYRTKYAPRDFGLSLVTFGLYVHPWEKHATYPPFRGLGHFDADTFDPASWVPDHSWRPTDVADRFDEFWAAEILLRLTPAHITAAVAAGQYTDARTADYLARTLLARQRALGAYALGRVAPLTNVTATARSGGEVEVCFDDLWLQYAYGVPAETRYAAATFDYAGLLLGSGSGQAAAGAHTCLGGLRAAPGSARAGYTIARIDLTRGEHASPPLFVHLANGADGALLVIGLDRR